MSRPVLEVDRLSKYYRRGAVGRSTLRELVDDLWRTCVRRKPGFRRASEAFWALRDVSFSVERGEVLGIIGANGAGKSTLLKILSRITEPTLGEVRLRGRVSSLLEVGTGFHPELSGRENIYLNGSILGLRRRQIDERFDQIVEFADVAEFLDTPVKHYSSGMYVRLAFAVAAHLEPEILIVDEVLAVGDQKFQEKCIGKMRDIASAHERTVLFVSHNMANIRQLCTSAVLLRRGQLVRQGPTAEVIEDYVRAARGHSPLVTVGGGGVQLRHVQWLDAETGQVTDTPVFNHDYILEVALEARTVVRQAMVLAQIEDALGTLISTLGTVEEGVSPFALEGVVAVRFRVRALVLTPGRYRICASVYRWFENQPVLEVQNAACFEVQPAPLPGAIASYDRLYGFVRVASGATVEQGTVVPR